VVYTAKSVIRGEGAHDYIDTLRSLKHRPNVVIADIAHTIALCGNRLQPTFFSPNDGRLAEVNDANLLACAENKASFRLPFLNEYHEHDHTDDCPCHPMTGSCERYSLFDWFHQGNVKAPSESLRYSSIVPELAGVIDTQTVEQFFSSLKRDLYFINEMQPVRHMFVCRLLFHMHNDNVNKKLYKSQTLATSAELLFNSFGQVYHGYKGTGDTLSKNLQQGVSESNISNEANCNR